MARPRLRWINRHQDRGIFGTSGTPAEPIRPAPVPPQSRTDRSGLEEHMNGIIYLVGLIVVVLFILSFLGLR
jgi:hypothetical protein